ncbi:MAG: hypothetical protein ABI045_05045 [Flavobacteriales bacterium]
MREDNIELIFSLQDYVYSLLGDYVLYRGKKYTLKSVPQAHKVSAVQCDYQFSFDINLSKLYDVLFLLDGRSEFFLYSDVWKFCICLYKI